MLVGSVKITGYPLHSLVSHSLPLPCVTMCHHTSTGLLSGVQDDTVNSFKSLFISFYSGKVKNEAIVKT
jgi:hypothetical protein